MGKDLLLLGHGGTDDDGDDRSGEEDEECGILDGIPAQLEERLAAHLGNHIRSVVVSTQLKNTSQNDNHQKTKNKNMNKNNNNRNKRARTQQYTGAVGEKQKLVANSAVTHLNTPGSREQPSASMPVDLAPAYVRSLPSSVDKSELKDTWWWGACRLPLLSTPAHITLGKLNLLLQIYC